MIKARNMPSHVRDRIAFALQPFNIAPYRDSDRELAYKLEYENGLVLVVSIMSVEKRVFWVLKQPPVLQISIIQKRVLLGANTHHLTRYIPLPKHENDMMFDIHLVAKFASMSRAVADILDGGECTSLPN